MKVVHAERVRQDIAAIYDYIALSNPTAAQAQPTSPMSAVHR